MRPNFPATARLWTALTGQLIAYAKGNLGDQLAVQTILNNADTSTLKGAQFCLGYGTSAAEMIVAGSAQVVATVPPDASAATSSGEVLFETIPLQ